MDKWLIGVALNFMLRQIAKFGASTNWELIKQDFDARIPQLVYFQWLVEPITAAVNSAIDVCAHMLSDLALLQKVADLCVAGDVLGALTVLKDELVKILVPDNVVHLKLKAAIDHQIECHTAEAA